MLLSAVAVHVFLSVHVEEPAVAVVVLAAADAVAPLGCCLPATEPPLSG